eukprot:6760769-Heterocapsa_arctica.AAC.1
MAQPFSTQWSASELNPSDEASRRHDPMPSKRRRFESRLPIAPPLLGPNGQPMTGASVVLGDR